MFLKIMLTLTTLMGEAAEVLHTAIKNYVEISCNPISPPEKVNILNNISKFRKKISPVNKGEIK